MRNDIDDVEDRDGRQYVPSNNEYVWVPAPTKKKSSTKIGLIVVVIVGVLLIAKGMGGF